MSPAAATSLMPPAPPTRWRGSAVRSDADLEPEGLRRGALAVRGTRSERRAVRHDASALRRAGHRLRALARTVAGGSELGRRDLPTATAARRDREERPPRRHGRGQPREKRPGNEPAVHVATPCRHVARPSARGAGPCCEPDCRAAAAPCQEITTRAERGRSIVRSTYAAGTRSARDSVGALLRGEALAHYGKKSSEPTVRERLRRVSPRGHTTP